MPPTLAKTSPDSAVLVRRAYFDCRFGQLHVRTAFSPNGGFDERTTLLCLHSSTRSGKIFDAVLPLIAVDRSAYAPDLPGCGESDPPPRPAPPDFAAAMGDLLKTLHVSKVDLLSYGDGVAVAAALAQAVPGLVRKRLDLTERDTELLASQAGVLVRRLREQFA